MTDIPVRSDIAFRILGPLEVTLGARSLPVPAGKQRILLATLLLHANRSVSVDELGRRLWDTAPVDVRGGVQKYVMRLRRALADLGAVVRTEPDGYRIEVAPGQLDLDRFDALLGQGEQAVAAGDPAQAAARLTEAVALWRRVPPLSDVASPSLARDEVPLLVDRYLHAQEQRIDAELRLGRGAKVGGELVPLIRDHPLRERFWVQRMRALYETGRQAEALEAYRTVTRLLADELGVDPGFELRELYQRILEGGRPASLVTGRSQPVPWQLPMPPAGVLGRKAEIGTIVATLGASSPEIPRIAVVVGPAGVGKTAIALHAAHELAGAFPDGQVYVDLATSSSGSGRAVPDVLAHLVRSLGTAPDAVPRELGDLVALYRSLTFHRRLLVVLDDAADEEQLRPLLPATTASAVLVTGRQETPGLIVSPGAHLLAVERLEPDDAREILLRATGPARAGAHPAAIEELLDLCAGLPLALRIAAAHLVSRPHLSVAAYAAQLRAAHLPDALRLDAGRPVSVGSAIGASYRRLAAAESRLLRRLSAGSADEITPESAAASTGWPLSVAHDGLERLAALSLLARHGDSGYRLDPLTRAYVAKREEVGGTAR
ncbi:BTAD domain-containing putative transcriptional regulator [Actinomycetes bacterium KLBMP 9759]